MEVSGADGLIWTHYENLPSDVVAWAWGVGPLYVADSHSGHSLFAAGVVARGRANRRWHPAIGLCGSTSHATVLVWLSSRNLALETQVLQSGRVFRPAVNLYMSILRCENWSVTTVSVSSK